MIDIAKSIIIDIADNWGATSPELLSIRSVELYGSDDAIIALTPSDFTGYQSSTAGTDYNAQHAFDTTKSKTGTWVGTSWVSNTGDVTNCRIICVLNTADYITGVTINNGHHNGISYTDTGAKNIKIYTSTDTITDTTHNAAIANSTLIFDGSLAQHSTSDAIEDQELFKNYYPTIPEISSTVSVDMVFGIILSLPEAILNSSADSGLFVGVPLSIPEITLNSSTDCNILLSVSLPEIIATTTADTDLQISLAFPEIEIESSADCDIFAGIALPIPEITLNSSADCAVLLSVSLPEITASTSADSNFRIILALPEISVLSAGTMDDVVNFQTGDAIIRYFLTITGSADSTTDVDIPLESFQARRRSGNPTYLQAIVPSVDFVDYIADRPNGTMQISQGYELNGEVLQREIIIETEIERADTYQGGQNNSIVLIGYTTSTFSGKSITLDQATYRSSVKGKIHYRLAEPNIFLNPGDSVTIGTDTFTVGVMSYAISATTQQIEIEEA